MYFWKLHVSLLFSGLGMSTQDVYKRCLHEVSTRGAYTLHEVSTLYKKYLQEVDHHLPYFSVISAMFFAILILFPI